MLAKHVYLMQKHVVDVVVEKFFFSQFQVACLTCLLMCLHLWKTAWPHNDFLQSNFLKHVIATRQ